MRNIGLILGSKTVEIAEDLKSEVDDYTFYVYTDIDNLILKSRQGSKSIDRVVILISQLQNRTSMERLYDYSTKINNTCSIVLLATEKTLRDSQSSIDTLKEFHEMFDIPLHTDMVIPNSTLAELTHSVKDDIETLRSKYSKFKVEDIEIEYDEVVNEDEILSKRVIEVDKPVMNMVTSVLPKYKLISHKPVVSSSEREIIKQNSTAGLQVANLISTIKEGIIPQISGDRLEFYVENNLMLKPISTSEQQIQESLRVLKEVDFILRMQNLIEFGKDANLLASEFVNPIGKPVISG